MKKLFLLMLVGNASTLALPGIGFAQDSRKLLQLKDLETINAIAALDKPANSGKAAADLSHINANAIRNFDREFKDVADAKWYEIEGGYAAKFTRNGIRNNVSYSRKGSWVATVRYYGEEKMPTEVRHIVKTIYYDFRIKQVIEVTFGDKTAYLVQIEDNVSLKTVRVLDGEMDVMQDLMKG